MSKKNIVLVGDVGGGKTVSLETLFGGTIDFNFDEGGWRSLERVGAQKILAQKIGRHPKELKFASNLREWFGKKEELQKNEILIIDYSTYSTPMSVGMLTNFDPKIYLDFAQDINHLESNAQAYKERGICHFTNDSLTGMQWYVLHGMVNLAAHASKGTSQYTYGLAIEKVREIVDTCCHLPFDYILTAHIAAEKDDIVGKIQETILLYGKKLPGILLSMIDDIYYASAPMMAGKKEFWFETSPQMFLKIIRQRSFDDLPIKIKPNFAEIYKEGGMVRPIEKK